MQVRRIELLSPARDADTGIEAIRHGADAVYIGASHFGARAAAGNSTDDIARLADYAHTFGARVYVTLNTILYDDELTEAERLIHELYRAGADALIVQDMGILRLDLPPIALHASTQTDNRTAEKVCELARAGFEQVVLARELSLSEIADIHSRCDVPLEAFVHGALCVSYSGRCYASQYCFGRSANRGACAQFCRLAFDVTDRDGHVLMRDKHVLSLRDMNRSDDLEAMLEAGISSFKIEGRLKDTAYVKNVTAWYRQRLDRILEQHPDRYRRASYGSSEYTFTPDLRKSFNRGFTDYFLHGRTPGICSFDTPKATGEPVGHVKELRGRSFTVAGLSTFHNGDGLCFIDTAGRLQGFRVNRAEGNRLFPAAMPHGLVPRTPLFRNHDAAFEQLLAKPSAERKLRIDFRLCETEKGFTLDATDEAGNRATLSANCPKETARTPQRPNWEKQLGKLGQTPFRLEKIEAPVSQEWFIPSSVLAEWRRQCVETLEQKMRCRKPEPSVLRQKRAATAPSAPLTYQYNIANREAHAFYAEAGATAIAPAFELHTPDKPILMTCKHCLRYSMGQCPSQQPRRSSDKDPAYLYLPDGRRFRLAFDCKNCQMLVYADVRP